MDLHQHHLALDRRVVGHIADLQDLDQSVHLLGDLLDILGLDHQRHAAHAGRLAMADRQALDIEAAPPEQAHRAVQHAGTILHQRDDRMLLHHRNKEQRTENKRWAIDTCSLFFVLCSYTCDASVIVSPMLFPCGTMGHTFTSRSTRKSINTGPSVAYASSI